MVYMITKFRDCNLFNQKLRQGGNFAATPLIQKGGPKSPRRIKLLNLVSSINLKRVSLKKLNFFHQNKSYFKIDLGRGEQWDGAITKKIDWKYNSYLSETARILREKLQEEGYVLSIRTFNAKE